MKQWWAEREDREKVIVILGGIIALLLLVYQYGIRPSAAFKSRMESAHVLALGDLAAVRAAEARSIDVRAVPSANQPLQGVISTTAEVQFGLTISRAVPAGNNGLDVYFDAVSPLLLYAWLGELERVHGIRVGGLSTVRKNSDNLTVNAKLYLSRG